MFPNILRHNDNKLIPILNPFLDLYVRRLRVWFRQKNVLYNANTLLCYLTIKSVPNDQGF